MLHLRRLRGGLPGRAIRFAETAGGWVFPAVDSLKCTDCGTCRAVCPGTGFAPKPDRSSEDPFLGKALRAYLGRAGDHLLHRNSQSGGLVTALLASALKSGTIAAALTVRMEPGAPPRAVAGLARSREELLRAQKSKYCPVPLLAVLREAGKLEGPLAVVGLGCQLQGLEKLLGRSPALRGKIRFRVGLICDRVLSLRAIDYLLAEAGWPVQEPSLLVYKDRLSGGFLGATRISAPGGRSATVPYARRAQVKEFFTPPRCRLCFDKMNFLADITCGDPWGIPGANLDSGESVAVIRTARGMELLDQARDQGLVVVREIPVEEVAKGQGIDWKRGEWRGYMQAWERLGRPVPRYWGRVAECAAAPPTRIDYPGRLRQVLALDRYPERRLLLRAARRQARRARLAESARQPLRLLKRALIRH